jgi:hypothetical protein
VGQAQPLDGIACKRRSLEQRLYHVLIEDPIIGGTSAMLCKSR